MVAIQPATSLNLVKDELDATLKQAETSLEAFIDEPGNNARLDDCIECFHQAWGALRILELPGAPDLAQELEHVARQMRESGDAAREGQLAALGNGIMVLGRYLEYIQLKNRNLPQMLVPAVNALRVSAGKPPVPESAFFACDMHAKRPGEGTDALEADDEVARLTRRLRQMYQVGLLGVLKGDAVATNLRMMDRALERVDRIGGGTAMGRLWWTARGALRALGQKGVEIDRTRKIFLGGVDRQLKQVATEGGSALRQEPSRVLLREGVYLASLLPPDDALGGQVRKVFRVGEDSPTAAELAVELEAMMGPGGSVIRTVAAQVRSDIGTVKDLLDAAMRRESGSGFAGVAEELSKVGHTLVMLGLPRDSQLVKERADLLRTWDDGREVDPNGSEFQSLIDDLLAVENTVASLEKRFTPGESQGADGDSQVSLYQLDDAKKIVIAECRAGIALAKRGLTSYIEANFDRSHLNNIPSTIKGVVGGLRFLNLARAIGVLEAGVTYIESRLMNADLPVPGVNDMETLADAITGVDYFLESMEEHKPIGEGVLEVAESSMEELGCPVTRRKAS